MHYVVIQGEIDLEEFIGVLYPMVAQALSKMTKDIKNVEDARFVFKQFDHDGDGLLSQEELRRSGSRFTNADINNNNNNNNNNININNLDPGSPTQKWKPSLPLEISMETERLTLM